MINLYLLIPAAYILGSIPFGVLIARTRGIDLRSVGSKNIGASNVLRTMGKLPALLTLLGDVLKGAAAVILCRTMECGELWEAVTGITVILGHMFSVFLLFRGGKGVATGYGVLAVFSPLTALIAVTIWALMAVYKKYSSLAAITSFALLPVVLILLGASEIKISFSVVLALLVILKHRSNIKRLLNGTEAEFSDRD